MRTRKRQGCFTLGTIDFTLNFCFDTFSVEIWNFDVKKRKLNIAQCTMYWTMAKHLEQN